MKKYKDFDGMNEHNLRDKLDNNVYAIVHDFGTDSYIKAEFDNEDEAIVELEKHKNEIYKEYGAETDDNYVWVKTYNLNDTDDREEYESLKNY